MLILLIWYMVDLSAALAQCQLLLSVMRINKRRDFEGKETKKANKLCLHLLDWCLCFDSRWPWVVSFSISKVIVSESEESTQPDPGPAHHLHTWMASPNLTPLPLPSGLRRVLPEPAQPGEQHQTRRITERRPGPLHQGQWDGGQQGELVQGDCPVPEELCQHGWKVRRPSTKINAIQSLAFWLRVANLMPQHLVSILTDLQTRK